MNERRLYPRFKETAKVTVLIESSPRAPSLEGREFSASTIDISLRGLNLLVDEPVPVGSRMELKVIMHRPPSTHRLSGGVVWNRPLFSNPEEVQLHTIGIKLKGKENPEFESWRETVAGLYTSSAAG